MHLSLTHLVIESSSCCLRHQINFNLDLSTHPFLLVTVVIIFCLQLTDKIKTLLRKQKLNSHLIKSSGNLSTDMREGIGSEVLQDANQTVCHILCKVRGKEDHRRVIVCAVEAALHQLRVQLFLIHFKLCAQS